jgi:cytochrome c oxidase assembly protein subunit 15
MTQAVAFDRPSPHDDRLVAGWLFAVAAMIFVMVVLGGITRLTESGLSITQWKPISGIVPPLDTAAWQREFDLYKQIPEFQTLHPDMTLGEFKGIFWWEYTHRLWGRLIGVVFALPGVWLLLRGRIRSSLAPRLLTLFVLGGLQGALGWFMVKSGLSVRTDVSQYRLVAHLLFALTIYGFTLWTAFDLVRPQATPLPGAAPLRRHGIILLLLIIGMLTTGGFVAGLDAGKIYNTFPWMGSGLIPGDLLALEPIWRNPVENPTAAQFVHRWLAMVVAATALALWLRRARLPMPERARLHFLAGMVAIQVALGISTLLLVVPVPLGALHQAGAVMLLTLTLWTLHGLRRAK